MIDNIKLANYKSFFADQVKGGYRRTTKDQSLADAELIQDR